MSNRIKLDRPKARAPLGEGRGEAVGAVNLYQCASAHRRFTINRDAGVTPSGMLCGSIVVGKVEHDRDLAAIVHCELRAASTGYVLPPDYRPEMVTHEWWLPTIEQAMCWPGKGRREREQIADHVRQHGMMLATLTPGTAQRFKVGPLLGGHADRG